MPTDDVFNAAEHTAYASSLAGLSVEDLADRMFGPDWPRYRDFDEPPSAGVVPADPLMQPVKPDEALLAQLRTPPVAFLPELSLIDQAVARGFISASFGGRAGDGAYRAIGRIQLMPPRHRETFLPNHVDDHVQSCLAAFERLQRDRSNWSALLEKAFYVESELIQFRANEQVYAEEVAKGLYSVPYEQAAKRAEAARIDASYEDYVATSLKWTNDKRFAWQPTEILIDEQLAWLGTLPTFKEDRSLAQYTLGDIPPNWTNLQGTKPQLTQKLTRIARSEALQQSLVAARTEETAKRGVAERSKTSFEAAMQTMDWEGVNQVARRRRTNISRSASFAKAIACSTSGGALNYREQMEGIARRMSRDLSEIVERSLAIETGLRTVYDIDLFRPDSIAAILDSDGADILAIDDLHNWVSDARACIEAFKQRDQNYVLPISLRDLMGDDAFEAGLNSSSWKFRITPYFFDEESHVRLRGVRLFAIGIDAEDGFWDARLTAPDEGVVQFELNEQLDVDQSDFPDVRLPRVGARSLDDRIEFVGASALANATPIGSANGVFGQWNLYMDDKSTQGRPRNDISDIELEFAIASRVGR